MNIRILRTACCVALAVTAGTASAAVYRFVPNTGSWWSKIPIPAGVTTATYSTLSSAISAARTGDTVWVKDGFVCDSGTTSISSTGGKARIKTGSYAFTLRSESGYVDEANGKGAYIRGEKVSAGSSYDKNNVRPIYASTTAGVVPVIQGFVLENGAVGNSSIYGLGGAVYGMAVVSNCVIRNCSAYAGGAFGSTTVNAKYVTAYNTVISNCHALATTMGGGAVYGAGSLYNCTVAGNTSACFGGAISDEDIKTAPSYAGCRFENNTAQSSGCASFSKDVQRATFTDCKILNNSATAGDVGGVRGMADLVRCTIAGNSATGHGGGVSATSSSVTLDKMPALTSCVVSNNVAGGVGGGLYCGVAKCCAFVGNKSDAEGAALYMPAGGQAYYSCLFGGNRSENGNVVEGNATTPLQFYNCTVARNVSRNASCVNGVNFHNSIIWDNVTPGEELAACAAEYSCVKGLTGTGNISTDPQLSDDYRLSVRNACVDTAQYYDWMDAAGDPRSFDAAGYPRIRGVSKGVAVPDRGSYERESPGSLVIGR